MPGAGLRLWTVPQRRVRAETPRVGQERHRPRPPRAAGRCGLVAPPSRCRAPSRIPGRGPAGARAGPLRR
eukprot:11726930-Alexandrium_andersonii.AAC.1